MHTQTDAPAAPTQVNHVTMYPIFGYRDLGAAIDWLCRVFSFAPQEVMQDEAGGYLHVELRLGDGVFMPSSAREGGDPTNPWNQPLGTQGVYVALDGIDAHYARAVAEGADIPRPLADTDYGSREYTARDLEGNLWCFGTYRPARR